MLAECSSFVTYGKRIWNLNQLWIKSGWFNQQLQIPTKEFHSWLEFHSYVIIWQVLINWVTITLRHRWCHLSRNEDPNHLIVISLRWHASQGTKAKRLPFVLGRRRTDMCIALLYLWALHNVLIGCGWKQKKQAEKNTATQAAKQLLSFQTQGWCVFSMPVFPTGYWIAKHSS